MVQIEVLKNPVLVMVAEKLGKYPAQIALRWGLQTGHSVLPKSTNEVRIRENFDVFDWSIPEDLFLKFSEIQQASYFEQAHGVCLGPVEFKISDFMFCIFQERLIKATVFAHETYGAYKTLEELWDGEI